LKQEAHYNIIILAAGASTRLGRPKQLLKYEDHNLVQHAIDIALNTKPNKVIVVLGAAAGNIAEHINKKQAHILYNDDWEEGIASSIRTAVNVSRALTADINALILMVCDQPYVTSALLQSLVAQHVETGKPIVAAQYKETLGTPVLFHESFFNDLLKLEGDSGAKKIIMDHKEQVQQVEFPLGDIDIDNMADYEMLLKKKWSV
jgi:molybdenum cofactor cytidylyltransferase